MDKIRVALVGCGAVSGRHLEAIDTNDKCVLTAVCDIDRERADKYAEKYNIKAFYDFDEMVAWNGFDSLHICTPHYLHTPMAIKAMENGKHVLCEKPLAMNYADAVKMCDVAEKNGVYLGVCFQNRYNSQTVAVKELLDSGEMGNVLGLKGFVTWERDEEYYTMDDWHGTLAKEGGSVVINQSIHTIDLLYRFAGDDVESVCGSVSAKKLGDIIETEDTADAYIKFKNGVTAVFYATLCNTVNSPVFIEIICGNGRIVIYDDVSVYKNGEEKRTLLCDAASGKKSYWGNNHGKLIDDFYNSVVNNIPFAVNGRSGSVAVKIMDGIYTSAKR